MIEWLDALRSDLDAELGRAPKVATLATVDNTLAEARSVVVRGMSDGGAMTFTSDGRSEKNRQLRANPSATLLFWLAKAKRQYRLAGTVAILGADDPRRREQWEQLGDRARALFLWPAPGGARHEGDVFLPAVPADATVPATFETLVLTPTRVERLDLNPTPHLRERWMGSTDGWSVVALNP